MFKLNLPKGIIESIKKMRSGEKAKITLQPKYAFKKTKLEDIGKYIDHINFEDHLLIERIKKTPLIYEITLLNFVQIYDLKGDRSMMKCITNRGEGLLKPSEGDQIVFNLSFFMDENKIFDKVNQNYILTSDYFSEPEITIFKSMKKNEKSKVDISKTTFQLICENENSFIKQILRENLKESDYIDSSSRVALEVELIKMKHNLKTVEYKNTVYSIRTLKKGIGYVSPWKNSLVMLMLKLNINGEPFYSDFNEQDEFINKISKIKSEIKIIPFFERNLQFLLEQHIKREGLTYSHECIYDPLVNNLPSFITKEIIPKMKLLETLEIEFNSPMDYLKIKDKEIINDQTIKNYKFTLSLFNFQEIPFIFNKNAQNAELIYSKLLEYKSIANYYFSNNLISKSRKINKFLVDEYIKFVNLESRVGKLTQNIPEFETSQIGLEMDLINKGEFKEINKEMKKVNSNLIMIYYKIKKFKKCNEYINHFFVMFDQIQTDEKILYFKYKILSEGLQQNEEAKLFLEKIIEIHPNSQMIEQYKKGLQSLENLISENQKKKNKMVKKMFKFD